MHSDKAKARLGGRSQTPPPERPRRLEPLPAPMPRPWPPREDDDLGPENLSEDIDWMSYPHYQLHEMVNKRVNLAGATSVAAAWANLGEDLEDIGAALGKALAKSADGWEGLASEAARGAGQELATWTEDTADRAKDVSTCVVRQADIAETARRTMPEPPIRALPGPVPTLPALPVKMDSGADGGTTPMSASPFVKSDFAGGAALIADPGPESHRAQQLHRRAAEVMQEMQRQSDDVYRDVPKFNRPRPKAGQEPRRPEPPVTPEPPEPPSNPPPDDNTAPSGDPVTPPVTPPPSTPPPSTTPTPPPVPREVPAGGGAALASGGLSGATAGGVGTGGQATTEQLGSGSRAGSSSATGSAPAAAGQGSGAAAGGQRGGMGMGAMPMGMAGAAGARGGGGDELDRKTPSYLEDDSDFWRSDVQVAPPVLGEDPAPRNDGR